MMDIGPGDFVEYVGKPDGYVNPRWCAPGANGLLSIGSVHRVIEVGRQCQDAAGQVWDSLVIPGLPRAPDGRATSAPVAAFRPIHRPKPGAFNDLLKAPDRKRVAA